MNIQTNFESLPREITGHIASFLPKKDCLSLRLTCSKLYQDELLKNIFFQILTQEQNRLLKGEIDSMYETEAVVIENEGNLNFLNAGLSDAKLETIGKVTAKIKTLIGNAKLMRENISIAEMVEIQLTMNKLTGYTTQATHQFELEQQIKLTFNSIDMASSQRMVQMARNIGTEK